MIAIKPRKKNNKTSRQYWASLRTGIKRVKRRCLRCKKLFKAHGKFNRICTLCTFKNEGIRIGEEINPGI